MAAIKVTKLSSSKNAAARKNRTPKEIDEDENFWKKLCNVAASFQQYRDTVQLQKLKPSKQNVDGGFVAAGQLGRTEKGGRMGFMAAGQEGFHDKN